MLKNKDVVSLILDCIKHSISKNPNNEDFLINGIYQLDMDLKFTIKEDHIIVEDSKLNIVNL